MAVSLCKGQRISLEKESEGLHRIIVGLGWDDVNKGHERGFWETILRQRRTEIDCDLSAIMLRRGVFVCRDIELLKEEVVEEDDDLICFNNLKHFSGAVVHTGDDRTGKENGHNEELVIDLDLVPQEYDRIVITANIYECEFTKQHFGMIKNAFINLINADKGDEICCYNLSDDYSGITAVIMGEIYRHNGEWKFAALGEGTNDTCIFEICTHYMQP